MTQVKIGTPVQYVAKFNAQPMAALVTKVLPRIDLSENLPRVNLVAFIDGSPRSFIVMGVCPYGASGSDGYYKVLEDCDG